MSKTDDYIIDKHNKELEQKEKSELKEFIKQELEWELRLDIWN